MRYRVACYEVMDAWHVVITKHSIEPDSRVVAREVLMIENPKGYFDELDDLLMELATVMHNNRL
jgi:hypothetical protein